MTQSTMITGAELPEIYYDQAGTLDTFRGTTLDGLVKIHVWDMAPICRKKKCPVHKRCSLSGDETCSAQMNFVISSIKTIFENFGSLIDEPKLFRVGVHAAPLYGQLFRCLIEEAGYDSIMLEDNNGKKYINPASKEIQALIRSIEACWKSLGIGDLIVETGLSL